MRSKRMQKEEKVRLRREMTQMIFEANFIRDEAAEKMYDVPKGYKLNGARDDVRFWLMLVKGVALSVGFLALLQWSMSSDDTIHTAVAIGCALVLSISIMVASATKNRPYRIEEHVRDYYVNSAHYGALANELTRLRTGIADYDRQYEERKEYIRMFANYRTEIEGFGSLNLVLKANDFHARLEMETVIDKVNCRLGLDENGYNQLTDLVNFFSTSTCV